MDLDVDFKSYQERIISSLVNVTRSAGQISNQDLSFHRSANEKFSQSLDDQNIHLLRLTNKLLKAAAKESSIKLSSLHDGDDVEDNWRTIVDVVDDLLEKADASLDEFTGALRRLSPTTSDAEPSPIRPSMATTGVDQWAQRSIPKPQLNFARKVNNYETGPWKPLLRAKPHAKKSLADSIGPGDEGYKHPYAYEIENQQFPDALYQIAEPIMYSPPEESQAVFVDTEEAVHQMLEELKTAEEIAVDLEHNDRNSFVGMVCLMQISTRNKDWIVDTLMPWRENLQILNEVFADPKITKVFHGSTSDIIWLQRDLGLYIVGLFDTFHACNSLIFPQKSLKYLLQRFANFEAQKQYQLADWRVRPLPKELIDYARSDTHFLLYIFDNLRNMLLEASSPGEDLMTNVLEASQRECLQVYERHPYDAENGVGPAGWLRLLMTRSTGFSNEQFGVFRALHEWRDHKARDLDEGEQSIFSNSYIFAWAEEMPTRKPMFHAIRGMGKIPARAAEFLPEIIAAIWKGREAGKKGPSIYEAIEKNGDKVGHMFGRNKYLRKPREDINRGVGTTVNMLNRSANSGNTNKHTDNSLSSDKLVVQRTGASHLFGNINPTFPPVVANTTAIEQALQKVLHLDVVRASSNAVVEPLPATTVPVTVSPNSITNGVSQVQSHQIDSSALEDRSRKRKAAYTLQSPVPPRIPGLETLDPISQDNSAAGQSSGTSEDEQRDNKRQKKADRQVRKAQREAEKKQLQATMVPFDYENANPVFNAKPEEISKGNLTSGIQPMNPFVRALDTSTGARRNRAGKELPGKSHTFTS